MAPLEAERERYIKAREDNRKYKGHSLICLRTNERETWADIMAEGYGRQLRAFLCPSRHVTLAHKSYKNKILLV